MYRYSALLLFVAANAALVPAQSVPAAPPSTPAAPGMPTPQPGSDPTAPTTESGGPPAFAPGVDAADEHPLTQPHMVRISGGVMAGYLVSKVNPQYPAGAHENGFVVLSAVIGKDGHVEHLTYLSGAPVFESAAMEAVKHWVYRPYQLNGQTVVVNTTVTVNFTQR